MFYSLIVFFDFTQSLAATVVVAIIIVVSWLVVQALQSCQSCFWSGFTSTNPLFISFHCFVCLANHLRYSCFFILVFMNPFDDASVIHSCLFGFF
jgi:hypothetical protein